MPQRPYCAIDHFMLRLVDAEPLFRLLADDFALPVSWPLERKPFATFGWVCAGNTHLELWAAASNKDLPPEAGLPLVHGFALDPNALQDDVAWLAERGIACRAPRTFRSPDRAGHEAANYTNCVIESLSEPSCCIFYCDWQRGAPIVPWPADLSAAERTAVLRRELEQAGGGPLGIVGVREVELETPRVGETRARWARFTGDATRLTDDIRLAIVEGGQLRIRSLALGVRDLDRARAALRARDLLGADTAHELAVQPRATGGLRLRMVPA